MIYFRFLRAQNATMPMTQATATTAISATSVVTSGASAACVGAAGSGSNVCAADVDSDTSIAVSENDL